MGSKYEKNLLNMAAKLDAVIDGEGEITRLSLLIVEKNDETATVELCKRISEFVKNGSKPVLLMAQELKNCIINYYGYLCVSKICNRERNDYCEEEDKSLSELLEELNELVGLSQVKAKVNDLIAYQKVQKMREEEGLHSQKSTLHLAFTGNPGTGKTTVARIVGRLYKKLGLLSKGHFIEVSRTDLIAGYQGQTALKVKNVIENAKGGVLFIDEAYSITENDHSDSYGRECLTELTKALEDYREDLVVIVAGYTEPMRNFFESNPGLKSRFNTFIEFDDYSSEELFYILRRMCEKNDYLVLDEAAMIVKDIIQDKVNHKGAEFANGRMIRNMYEDLILNHARRVSKLERCNHQELIEIRAVDVNIQKYDD